MTEFKELIMYSKNALEAITQNMDKAVHMVPYLTKLFVYDLVMIFFFVLVLYLNRRVEVKRTKAVVLRESKREKVLMKALGWVFCQGFLTLLIIVIMTFLIFRTVTTITLPLWNTRYQKTLESVLFEPLLESGYTRSQIQNILQSTGLDSLSNCYDTIRTSLLKIGDVNTENLYKIYQKIVTVNFDDLKTLYIEHITPSLDAVEPITNLATKTMTKSMVDLGIDKIGKWPIVGSMLKYTRNLIAPGAALKAAELGRLKEDLTFGFTNFGHYFLPSLFRFYKNVFISSFGTSLSITALLQNRKTIKTMMNRFRKFKKQKDSEMVSLLQDKLQKMPSRVQAVEPDYGPLKAYHQMIILPIS